PALQQARERGKAGSCVNNLKQIGTATQMYIDAYDAYFPYAVNAQTTEKALAPFTGYDPAVYPYNNKPYSARGCWACPSDTFRHMSQNGKTVYFAAGSYSTNHYAKPFLDNGMKDGVARLQLQTTGEMQKLTKVRYPGNLIYAMDAEKVKNNAKVTEQALINVNTWPFADALSEGRIDFRHSSQATTLWIDGHVNFRTFADIYKKSGLVYQPYYNMVGKR
ncbi:MAG: DUF1559 domain-containing protein, partial [Lentisphaeria bacterium]|nr:DUF1559 domain-containing protein [Lentisphaeria bacterium]